MSRFWRKTQTGLISRAYLHGPYFTTAVRNAQRVNSNVLTLRSYKIWLSIYGWTFWFSERNCSDLNLLASKFSRWYFCIYICVNIMLHTVSFVALPLLPPISSVPTPVPTFTLKLTILRDLYFCGSLENPQNLRKSDPAKISCHAVMTNMQRLLLMAALSPSAYEWIFCPHQLSDSKTPTCLETEH